MPRRPAGNGGTVEIHVHTDRLGFHAHAKPRKGHSAKPIAPVSFVSVAINATFPPYRQVIPAFDAVKPCPMHVNPAYLADLCVVADAFNRSENDGVEFMGSGGDDLSPILFACGPDAARDVIVVIMPMRGTFSGREMERQRAYGKESARAA